MRLRYRHKLLTHGPVAASAVLLTLGAFNSDCGVRESPLQGSAVSFQDEWTYRPILLEEADNTRCVELQGRTCKLSQKGTGDTIDIITYDGGCWVRQDIDPAGDSVVLGCSACGSDGSSMEIFRVNSSLELYGFETEIVDRDNPSKRFVVPYRGTYYSCAGYLGLDETP